MSERAVKQVIVMRKDLNMRKGKMIAQGAHASLGAVWLIEAEFAANEAFRQNDPPLPTVDRPYHEAYVLWRYHQHWTKVCVSVNSEAELDAIASAAEKVGLPVNVVTDLGHTEFHGVPTRTCLAIGPAWAEDIDQITGGLPLL